MMIRRSASPAGSFCGVGEIVRLSWKLTAAEASDFARGYRVSPAPGEGIFLMHASAILLLTFWFKTFFPMLWGKCKIPSIFYS